MVKLLGLLSCRNKERKPILRQRNAPSSFGRNSLLFTHHKSTLLQKLLCSHKISAILFYFKWGWPDKLLKNCQYFKKQKKIGWGALLQKLMFSKLNCIKINSLNLYSSPFRPPPDVFYKHKLSLISGYECLLAAPRELFEKE